MTEEAETYGEKIKYDTNWSGPMNKKRDVTDVHFLRLFGIFCILWMGIAVYAHLNKESKNENLARNYVNMRSIDDHGIISETNQILQDGKMYGNYMKIPTVQEGYDAISKTYKSSAGSIAAAFIAISGVLCFSYIILLRWFAKLIIYTLIVLFFIALFVVICIISMRYATNNDMGSLALLILCIIIFFTATICFLLVRKKINIACEAIKESSKAVISLPSTLLSPLLPSFLYSIVLLFALSTAFNLAAFPRENEEIPQHIKVFHGINVFGCLWFISFISAFSQMTLAGTFATWYWTMNKKDVPDCAIVHFMKVTIRYHLGTLAFGSLIIAVCQTIKILLSSIKRFKGKQNSFACFSFGWYLSLYEFLEKILKYINRNAYIMCAVHGTSFYQSAKDAFNLLMRNIVKVLVITKLTNAILLVGQILTISISVLGAWKFCDKQGINDDTLTITLISVFIGSALVSASFFGLLRMAITTIFLCVLEDYERNDGSVQKPYYMSSKLKNLLFKE